jgi:hypothetical protein
MSGVFSRHQNDRDAPHGEKRGLLGTESDYDKGNSDPAIPFHHQIDCHENEAHGKWTTSRGTPTDSLM